MLTAEEQRFVDWWKSNRELEKKAFRKLSVGLAAGFMFACAIILSIVSGWYKRANMAAFSSFNPFVFLIALTAIIWFITWFYNQHRWDMNEQRYKELLAKKKRTDNAA